MDVIAWTAALIAGLSQPTLRRAIAIGMAVSVGIRAYQYFLAVPRAWGHTMPEDLFGAVAMLTLTALFAWVGSIIRVSRQRRTEAVT